MYIHYLYYCIRYSVKESVQLMRALMVKLHYMLLVRMGTETL